MRGQRKDTKRRGQPSPGAIPGGREYVLYDPDDPKKDPHAKRSSYKPRWVTHKEAARLTLKRARSAQARLDGRIKSRKRRYTEKGKAFKNITKYVHQLCTLLKASQRGSRIYHEPEQSVVFFWKTVDALVLGRQTWYNLEGREHKKCYVRHPPWSKVEALIDEIEDLIWSWGFHRYYKVWSLWRNKGMLIKAVIREPNRVELIKELIEKLPHTEKVPDEYMFMPLLKRN